LIPFRDLMQKLEPQGLASLGDQLLTYQSHHHALFLDRSVSDALGAEGRALCRQAAFEASRALLSSLAADFGLTSSTERLVLASELFAALGHGRLSFEVTQKGGIARGEGLYFGASFAEKYGPALRSKEPACAFTAGFTSAAATLAFPASGLLLATETECVAHGDARCTFALIASAEEPRLGAVVTRPLVEQISPHEPAPGSRARLRDGSAVDEATTATVTLGRLLHAVGPDEAGALRAFGQRLALVPASYTAQITYDTIHLIEARAPELLPLVATLAREAAQMGAFFLLGGALASDAYRDEDGPPAADPEARLDQLTGLASALGWGTFTAHEFEPGRTLVLRSPMTFESAYHSIRHSAAQGSRLYVLQGLGLAIMQLVYRVDFTAPSPISRDAYDALFKSGPRFEVEETRSPLRGDGFCEVRVQAV